MAEGAARAASREAQRLAVFQGLDGLLQTRPWADVTLSTVAEAVGLSRQTLYNQFGSRDGLAAEYALWAADRFLDDVRTTVRAGGTDLATSLETAFAQFLSLAAEHPLIRALEAAAGADGVRTLVSTRAGAPVVQRGVEGLSGLICEVAPQVPAAVAEDLAEVLVRLAVSYVTVPTAPAVEASARVRRVFEPFVALYTPSPERGLN